MAAVVSNLKIKLRFKPFPAVEGPLPVSEPPSTSLAPVIAPVVVGNAPVATSNRSPAPPRIILRAGKRKLTPTEKPDGEDSE
ncbi:hypothetical protein ABW21_db0208891 [Orbilia brochopaga]|nr:hypothetical protein ABW21_db0208891 [Drechslerella brochopaga]